MSLALCIKLIRRHKLPRKIFCGIFDDDCAFQNPPSWKEKQNYFSSQPSFWKTELLISKEHTFYCNNIIYINSCDFFFSKRWGNNLTFSWTRYKSIFYFSPPKALMIEQKRRDHDEKSFKCKIILYYWYSLPHFGHWQPVFVSEFHAGSSQLCNITILTWWYCTVSYSFVQKKKKIIKHWNAKLSSELK